MGVSDSGIFPFGLSFQNERSFLHFRVHLSVSIFVCDLSVEIFSFHCLACCRFCLNDISDGFVSSFSMPFSQTKMWNTLLEKHGIALPVIIHAVGLFASIVFFN